MKKHTHYIQTVVAGTLTLSLLPLQVFALAPQKIMETELPQTQKVLSLELEQKKQDILNRVEEKKASAQFRSNQIVVKYKNDSKPFRIINLPNNITVLDAVKKYTLDDDVEYAEPDFMAYADMVPNDQYYKYQWHMDNTEMNNSINAEEAWDISTGISNTGEQTIVAVIDTGIAYENYSRYYQAPDLANTCFVQGYDFINNDNHPNDDNKHGTHVAGTIAQSTNNNIGVAGVAFDACLMPVKALDRNGSGSYTAIANAIYYAVDNGAQVINMSLGGSSDASVLKDAVAYAYNNDVTVIAAAGNSETAAPHYPSSYNEYVISVGATDYNKNLAPYSNYGPDIDVVAPGGDTSIDANGDGYVDGVLQQTFASSYRLSSFGYYFFQGTSMAAPHVAGTAALLIANGNATTPDNIRTALESTTQDLGATGRDDIFGHGLIDAAAALGWNAEPIDNPPTVSITNPTESAVVVGTVIITADASDDNGVNQVDFYIGEVWIGTDTLSPYAIDWDSTSVSDGEKTITATAMDTASQSGSDSIIVTVDNVNDKPTANAGDDQTVSDSNGDGSETITLDGSGSYDADGTIVSYEWKEGITVIATNSTATLSATVGVHTYTLTVTDNDGATSSDNVAITVLENQAPSANAGDDQTATLGTEIIFDGSGSTDPDGTIVNYKWDFGDESVEKTGKTVTHTYTTADTYTVTLTVTDNGGLTDEDTAKIIVMEEPSELEVFYDSFEVSEWNGLWTEDSQNDWFRSSQRATDGAHSAEVDGRAQNASLTSTDIYLQGKTNASITFDWLIERTLDRNEYLAVDISTNSGATWQEYARLKGNVDKENVWHQETIEINGVDNIMLRFRGKMSRSNEDANVDNVRVVAR